VKNFNPRSPRCEWLCEGIKGEAKKARRTKKTKKFFLPFFALLVFFASPRPLGQAEKLVEGKSDGEKKAFVSMPERDSGFRPGARPDPRAKQEAG
jgi:hypothetical protein